MNEKEENLRFLMLCSVIFLIFLLPHSAIPMLFRSHLDFFRSPHHTFFIYEHT